MIDYKFYDTSSLLKLVQSNSIPEEKIYLSSITLKELENIKNSDKRNLDVKFAARTLANLIWKNPKIFEVLFYKEHMIQPIVAAGLPINDDMRILATAIDFDNRYHPDEIIFYSDDILLKETANLFFGDGIIQSIEDNIQRKYTGYKEIQMTEQQMSDFYTNQYENQYDLLINEYIIVKNEKNEQVDARRWDGEKFQPLKHRSCRSKWFGDIKPIKGDIYQSLVLDSFYNNEITMVCGKPGSGKSLLALSFLFSLLEDEEIDRIVIFCNPVVAKNAAKLGFYPGTVEEKLLSSQVGGILSSKLGSQIEVERLIDEEKLVLIPAGDIRGYETPENSGVYIMESQNLTKDLMRLFLQRVGKNCKIIIDGDYAEQVDMDVYAGENNGMIAASKVFRGEDLYGQVELQKIHRNRIGEIADKIR